MTAAKFATSDIEVVGLSPDGAALVTKINAIIDDVFYDNGDAKILSLEPDKYFSLVLTAQRRVNGLEVIKCLFDSERSLFERALRNGKGAAQRIAYLRAVRPFVGKCNEYVGFHRESFFNPDMVYATNIWLPIRNVTLANSVRFVPESQLIHDDSIETVNEGIDSGLIKQYTSGHKIGLLYDQKRIISGVDFSKTDILYVPQGQIAAFNANLIHGAGVNNTDEIRFSLDFRIIDSARVSHRDYNYAARDDYFFDLE